MPSQRTIDHFDSMDRPLTITMPRRDANHAAFALHRQAQTWRELLAADWPDVTNGFTEALKEQADAADRVATMLEEVADV